MGPSFVETGDEMITHDENSSQELRMGPNQLSHLNWCSYEFNPSFEFALPVDSLPVMTLIHQISTTASSG
jgi:hypothetical protein